jgi:hypothetical protein
MNPYSSSINRLLRLSERFDMILWYPRHSLRACFSDLIIGSLKKGSCSKKTLWAILVLDNLVCSFRYSSVENHLLLHLQFGFPVVSKAVFI